MIWRAVKGTEIMIDNYSCPFPWCGFKGEEGEIKEHVPNCG